MSVSQNILITGGAGFIGSRLALRLLANGHKVRVLDNLAPQIHGVNPERSPLYCEIKDKVEFIRGSVTNREDVKKVLKGMDTVVHLAAETGTGQSMYAIQHYADVNIGGTALLLDVIANHPFPIKKIVVASSRAVYGEGKYQCREHNYFYPDSRSDVSMAAGDFELHCPVCGAVAHSVHTDEQAPARPGSVYGVTKLTQEQMVLTVGKALGISSVALRYQNVYGPGQSLSNPYTGILSIFSTRIKNGLGINIFEDGRESRDFIFVDDAVCATAEAVEYPYPLVDAFNVGTGVATDVLTIAKTLNELLSGSSPIKISGQFRVGDIRHNVANLEKVKAVFGFQPSVAIREGLCQFTSWVKGEKIQSDHYDQSLKELREKGLLK